MLKKVLEYHERTKHQPYRFAASLGYLDWANQPEPFRSFEGAERRELPFVEHSGIPSLHGLDAPLEAAPLEVASISRLFELSLAITAWKAHAGSRWALRANPSSGNLHPTEGYAILPAIMKAKKKEVKKVSTADVGAEPKNRSRVLTLAEPPPRKAGQQVASVDDLMDKLVNEAKAL